MMFKYLMDMRFLTKKHWSLLIGVILFAILLWGLSSNSRDAEKQLEKKWKEERKVIFDVLTQKEIEIQKLTDDIAEERSMRKSDSLRHAGEITKRDRIIIQMKKRNENISFDSYSDYQLDSLRSAYWPRY